MTPVENLEAAIARLEGLRMAATPGPWFREDEDEHFLSHNYPGSDDFGFTIGPGVVNEFECYVAPVKEADGLLILVLHRTVDAQLSMLRNALGYLSEYPDRPRAIYSWVADAIRLAEAILSDEGVIR